ncbi:MAG: PAS domain S-box protein [Gammaproteobacteria bacterium]|nr:PAS domain S-box protein [Gammaproteobacteria bacterium]MBQ0839879.1 PAS domain S-box protein [Gammaproteobacteria bacterium]
MSQDSNKVPSSDDVLQYLRIIDHVEDILWACDASLKLTYVSPAVERVTGFSVAERMQLSLEQTITPASIETLQHVIAEQAGAKNTDAGPVRCNIEAYRKDGSTYSAEASLSITRNEQGEMIGLVGSNRDMSQRSRAEKIIKAIHNSTFQVTGEQYLNNLVLQLSTTLNMRYAFIAKVANGISQTLSFCDGEQLADNFSYSLSGSPCENVVAGAICYYPHDITALFPHEQGLKRLGVNSYIGTPIPDANGDVQGLLVLMDDQPMVDVPLLRRVLEVCADRTGAEMSRRESQSRLEESEQRFRALFEQSIDPCFMHNKEGQIIRANKSMETAFGYSSAEFNELTATVLSGGDTKTKTLSRAAFQQVMTTGSARYETYMKRKSGEVFPVEVTSQLINIEGEELVQSIIRDLSEQQRLREKDKNTQQRLEKLFSAMQTMIAMVDVDAKVTYANTTPLTNPDAHQASLLDTKIWDYEAFCHKPLSQAQIKKDIAAALKGKSTQSDIHALTPGGLMWMQLNIHPIRDEQGQVSQLLLEGSNIDQRKKMAEQLLSAEQRRKLFRVQAPMPVIEWDVKRTCISEWNAAAEKLFGYSDNEAIGQQPGFLTPDNVAVDTDQISNALQSATNKVFSKNRSKDGRNILCEWYNSPINDDAGKVIAVVSIVRDITAEHQAQQIVKGRESQQRAMLNAMLDAVFTVDETGVLLSFNHAAEQLFGHTAEAIIGQPCWQLIPEQYVASHRHYMQRYIETRDDKFLGVSAEIEGLRNDGSTFPSRMAIAPLQSTNQGQQQFIVSMYDLSRVKQQEEQLRRSQKMEALGKLTGGIAHDFNNMLGVILGYADLLTSLTKDQPTLEKYANEIYRAGERGAQLTDKLLGFSRQKASIAEIVDINALLQAQHHMLERALTPRIKILFALDNELWPVHLDKGDLEDAILNISINAMHAMPSGGQLSLSTHNESINAIDTVSRGLEVGDYVVLNISDTGCGMDKETREKVFDPFFSTKGELGTGLGLSQVYGFVERSGGSTKIYSEVGHGTHFALYFPRHRIQSNAENLDLKPQTSTQNKNPRNQESILVVDDEAALLDLTAEILKQQGYKVIAVESARQALEVLEDSPVSLLLTDIIMPDMDGYQLATIVQQQYPAVKIQLASGFTDDRHAGKLQPELHNKLLQKPYKVQALLDNIRELLAQGAPKQAPVK